MPHGIDAPMHGVQLAPLDPRGNCATLHASIEELPPSHQPMLPRGQLRNQTIHLQPHAAPFDRAWRRAMHLSAVG